MVPVLVIVTGLLVPLAELSQVADTRLVLYWRANPGVLGDQETVSLPFPARVIAIVGTRRW